MTATLAFCRVSWTMDDVSEPNPNEGEIMQPINAKTRAAWTVEDLNADTGWIYVTLGNHASPLVKGGRITLTRDPAGSWACNADTAIIGAKYAPANCPPN